MQIAEDSSFAYTIATLLDNSGPLEVVALVGDLSVAMSAFWSAAAAGAYELAFPLPVTCPYRGGKAGCYKCAKSGPSCGQIEPHVRQHIEPPQVSRRSFRLRHAAMAVNATPYQARLSLRRPRQRATTVRC